jgi:hypothetical protein
VAPSAGRKRFPPYIARARPPGVLICLERVPTVQPSFLIRPRAGGVRRSVRRTARHLWLDKFLAWCGRAWKGVASTHTRPHSNAMSGTERPFFTGVSVLNRSSDRRSHESNPWPQCAFETSMFCYLQFTLIHAVGCVLHRSTSRVIHRSELFLGFLETCPFTFFKQKV